MTPPIASLEGLGKGRRGEGWKEKIEIKTKEGIRLWL
jgi:hypothetical protein